jgi:hypothetical protein
MIVPASPWADGNEAHDQHPVGDHSGDQIFGALYPLRLNFHEGESHFWWTGRGLPRVWLPLGPNQSPPTRGAVPPQQLPLRGGRGIGQQRLERLELVGQRRGIEHQNACVRGKGKVEGRWPGTPGVMQQPEVAPVGGDQGPAVSRRDQELRIIRRGGDPKFPRGRYLVSNSTQQRGEAEGHNVVEVEVSHLLGAVEQQPGVDVLLVAAIVGKCCFHRLSWQFVVPG